MQEVVVVPDPVVTFDTKEIKSKEESVYNLKLFIDVAFKIIDKNTKDEQIANMVLVIGTPGCGKSSFLSSLILGSDKLEMKKFEYET